MAQPPEENETFLREVEDELSYDRLLGFFRTYGKALMAGLVAGLLGYAGFIYWNIHKAEEAGVQGEQLSAAIQDLGSGTTNGVAAKLAPLASQGNEGYRASAKLLSAAMAQEKGDLPTAIAGFKAVADDTSLHQNWRDAGLIRQTMAEYDTLSPDVVIARMQPLAVSGKPWFGVAGEMQAMAYLKQHKPAQAGPIFAAIAKDTTQPDSLRARAQQMAAGLGFDAAPPPPAVKD